VTADPAPFASRLRERVRGGRLGRGGDRPPDRDGAPPRDHAILVRANDNADPILRSLNMAGIPWRFSGTSGCTPARGPLLLSFLRASRTCRRAWTSTRSRLGPVRARWRGPDRDRQHGPPPQPLRVGRARGARSPARHPAHRARAAASVRRLVATCGLRALAHERPAGEVLYAFLRGTGCWRAWPARTRRRRGGAPEHRPLLRDRPRAVGAACGRPGVFVARHLQTLIEAGDDPPPRSSTPTRRRRRADRPQGEGLEFPVVFLPGLVAGRFPLRPRRAAALPRARPGEPADAETSSRRSGGCSTWP
jgi:hypothetical protein